jgi:hypothetical protein
MTAKGIFKTMVFLTMFVLPISGGVPQAMAEEQTAFENNLQKLTPAQLEELQKRVAEYQIQGDAQAMTLEEIRAQYVALIEKTVGDMSRSK